MIAVANKVNPAKYGRLLTETLPVTIRSEAEYERALEAVNALMSKPESGLTPEEDALLDLLATLIERYEDEHHPIPDAPGHEVLAFLLQERGLKQSDLLPVFKSRGIISELVSGKRPIGVSIAKKLEAFFDINPEVFLTWDRLGPFSAPWPQEF
jgi:HTH-type transcriptional regulator/antitoxin HigA